MHLSANSIALSFFSFKCKEISDGKYPVIKCKLTVIHNVVWKQMEFSLKLRQNCLSTKTKNICFLIFVRSGLKYFQIYWKWNRKISYRMQLKKKGQVSRCRAFLHLLNFSAFLNYHLALSVIDFLFNSFQSCRRTTFAHLQQFWII